MIVRVLGYVVAIPLVGLALVAVFAPSEQSGTAPPNPQRMAASQLVIDQDRVTEYIKLAALVGLDYNRTYRYREYSDVATENQIGIAGHYDFLRLSTGGTGWDAKDQMRTNDVPEYWETIYYENVNLTITKEVTRDGEHAYVKLLKLARGRVPDLHLQ